MKSADLRVKAKLLPGFALFAAIVLIVSALSLRSLGRSSDRFGGYVGGVANARSLFA